MEFPTNKYKIYNKTVTKHDHGDPTSKMSPLYRHRNVQGQISTLYADYLDLTLNIYRSFAIFMHHML
jgi:hypothetical protein